MREKTPEWHRRFIPPAIFFVVSLVFSLPLLLKWDYIGPRDWELFTTMAGVPVRSLLHYGQFPFWNPYLGGGNILFAHPEAAVISPFFPLMLLCGELLGLKLQIFLAFFLGFYGTFLWVRKLGLSEVSSCLASFVYFGSSYFILHFAAGHIPFTHFCFLPWAAYFLLKAEADCRWIFASGLTLALIILGNGGAIPFLYTCFFIGLWVILRALENREFRPVKYFIFALVTAIMISAVKFLPMIIALAGSPWAGRPDDFTPAGLLPSIFFSFDQYIFKAMAPDHNWPWHEYGAFIPPLAAILALAAAVYRFRRSRPWIIIALFFLVFGLGNFGSFSPWNLFLQLPGFSSIRVPARAFQFVVLAAAVMAGLGLDYLLDKYKSQGKMARNLSIGLVALIIAGNFLIALPTLQTIDYRLPEKAVFNEEFRQDIGGIDKIYGQFRKNRGSLIAPWLSAYRESRGIVAPGNVVYMEYISRGQADIISRHHTPNRVEYRLNGIAPGTIIFSIGYDTGWIAADGRRLYEESGVIAADFAPGEQSITLVYRAPYFYAGLIISTAALLLCLLIVFHRKTGQRLETIFK